MAENKTYSEKLKNPKWQKKRLEVLNRDQFKCCLCKKDTEELHVHHKSYEYGREPWDYDLSNFETLCKTCHFVVEFLKKDDMELLHCYGKGNMRMIVLKKYPDMAFVAYINDDNIDICGILQEDDCKNIIKLIRKKK